MKLQLIGTFGGQRQARTFFVADFTGNGYLEVARNRRGQVGALYHAPGRTMRRDARFRGYWQVKQAREQFQTAQKLDPDNWNYHRQEWSYSTADQLFKFGNKVRKLGGKPYYEPLDMPTPADK